MRSGLGFPVVDEHGRSTIGFENSAVYQDAADAFDAAQRSIVATVPGSVYRYINAGINVLGAIIRDRMERRGLPYHTTLYGLLADRLGMSTYQHSADCMGNFIASGSGFATLRDYAKLGVLYVQDGMWDGERLLPPGLGRLCAHADARRQQLRRMLPQQCRSQLPRSAAGYRMGVGRVRSTHLHPAPA